MKTGEYVMVWFDTGALGVSPLYGIVEKATAKTFMGHY